MPASRISSKFHFAKILSIQGGDLTHNLESPSHPQRLLHIKGAESLKWEERMKWRKRGVGDDGKSAKMGGS